MAIFSDVDCAPCRTMHREIEKRDDTTVYVFVYPLLSSGQNQDVLERIWCAPDRRDALDRAMAGNNAPVRNNLATGKALGIKSVPAMNAPNGRSNTAADERGTGVLDRREPESPLTYGRPAAADCGSPARPSTCRSRSVATIHAINVPHTAS